MLKLRLTSFLLLSVPVTFARVHPRASNGVPVIDLGYAKYQGVFDSANNVTNYLGIRYAAPPTGDLRWRAPQTPADNSSVVQLANTQPLPCFQAPTGEASTNPLETLSKRASAPGSPTEDCLFLNVYFPGDIIPVEPLPTLVWIHGGGYIMGGADTFTGSDLMREANNEILLVIIQYRLGLFGFLAGSEVKEDGDLNAGLLDQDFALRWVQSHILQFGGDPSKVTIWGESAGMLKNGIRLAGAGSVLQHIVAQDGRTSPQLFRGAITSSTFLPSQYMFNDYVPELLYSEVVSQAQCTTANDSLACLRTVDAATLGTINSDINAGGFFGTFLFVPVVDGTFITKRPTEVLKQGTVNGNALLSITNANEGTVFVNQTAPITNVSLYASTLFPKFGSQAEVAAQLYANLGTPLQQDDLVMGESIFICPTYYLLNSFPDSGWKLPTAVPPATHGADVVYYFTSQGTPEFNNTDFLTAFQTAFMSFVISQDPNDKLNPTITPSWNLYSQGNTEMIFNKTIDGQPDVDVDSTDNDLLQRAPVIDLGYAQYQGVFDSVNNITSYLGIRYAAPPIDDLRWRAPQPPTDNSSTVQLANTQPLPCFQAGVGLAPNSLEVLERRATIGDPIEDCLFLKYVTLKLVVYFPGDTIPAGPLPTLVWIHGGGYVMGGADEYPGSDLMREANNGIVLVIIQYRLGIFGFLAGSKVKENGNLNAGLLDQDFALRWVQTHISQFGGDPSKVTIWGESAGRTLYFVGAGSVVQHIVAQDGQTSPQLFRGAITSSTFLPSQYAYNDTIPELLYSKVVSQTECSSANDSLTCLRAVDAVTLETLNNNIIAGGFYGTFIFVPVVDGTFIMQRPTEALAQGKVNGKALLSITNANEGTIFVNQIDPITNVSLYSSMLFPEFESQQADDTAELYANLGSPLEQDDLIMGESIFICPTYYLLDAFPDSGWKVLVPPATHGADVVYYYTRWFVSDMALHRLLTLSHSIGVPDFPNPAFLAAFQGAFMSFVVSQDPNDKIYTTITPSWNLYSEGNTEMIFNRTVDYQPDIHVSSTDNGLLERCK
ncbi:MAG: Alpha/Beta hydrolase protein [Lentinula lateritia]|nr:MAG: Alpha/Beta hydrolase protein [Lentinula lateritia]